MIQTDSEHAAVTRRAVRQRVALITATLAISAAAVTGAATRNPGDHAATQPTTTTKASSTAAGPATTPPTTTAPPDTTTPAAPETSAAPETTPAAPTTTAPPDTTTPTTPETTPAATNPPETVPPTAVTIPPAGTVNVRLTQTGAAYRLYATFTCTAGVCPETSAVTHQNGGWISTRTIPQQTAGSTHRYDFPISDGGVAAVTAGVYGTAAASI